MRVLLIEDDVRLARIIQRVCIQEQYAVDVAHDGDAGLELLLRDLHDVAVLDWMLPKRDGPALCRVVRASLVTMPILLLTARGQLEDRVAGLDSGADDYLVKPFSLAELMARIRALSRRKAQVGIESTRLQRGEITLDLSAHTAHRAGHPLHLTITEWKMLEYLMRNPGKALSREQLLDYVWAYDKTVQIKIVDIYILYLRQKLNVDNLPDMIESVRGIGYRFKA
ncbi:MAG: response regulator transcription factor [Anaerolineae bacterium]|nr:response regulator transcription factor [Anaerolineae bacterium]